MKDEKIIDPNWIKKAPAWKMFLAKLFGKKITGVDGEYYAVSYQFLGKRYYAGGGLFFTPKPQTVYMSNYTYLDENGEEAIIQHDNIKVMEPKL